MKIFISLFLLIFFAGCNKGRSSFIKDTLSDFNTTKTVENFTNALEQKNYKVVSSFNHERVAKSLKEYLRPTVTVNLNNPKISTKLISCNPSMALELPIRVAVYRELNGKIHLVYTNPEYWSLKHNIKDKECIDLIMLLARDFSIATDSVKKGR